VLEIADLRDKLATQSIEVRGGTPEALQAELEEEIAKWGRVIEAAHIKPEQHESRHPRRITTTPSARWRAFAKLAKHEVRSGTTTCRTLTSSRSAWRIRKRWC